MKLGLFVLEKEDHTIGNLLRIQLLRDKSVRFAGYKMPHPLNYVVHIKVETMDSRISPINAFEAALQDLGMEVETLETEFNKACNEFEHEGMTY